MIYDWIFWRSHQDTLRQMVDWTDRYAVEGQIEIKLENRSINHSGSQTFGSVEDLDWILEYKTDGRSLKYQDSQSECHSDVKPDTVSLVASQTES